VRNNCISQRTRCRILWPVPAGKGNPDTPVWSVAQIMKSDRIERRFLLLSASRSALSEIRSRARKSTAVRRQSVFKVVIGLVGAVLFGGVIPGPVARAGSEDVVPKEWLDRQISVEQAEAQYMVEGVPFGAQAGEWTKLKNSLGADDNLWTYCSSYESFKALAGRCGIAVVHDGKVVRHLVTMMN
jgi:hypothetical protein